MIYLAFFPGMAAGADERIYDLELPAQSVAVSLNSLSEQTGVPVLFSYDLARDRRANAVRGRYPLLRALDILLEGTGLSGGLSDKGVLTISLAESHAPEPEEQAREGEAMPKHPGFFSRLSAFVLSAFVAAPGAHAQAEGDRPRSVIEEIVVTAQKREQSLQDVSGAVTAIGADRLRSAQIHNIEDLQVVVPSIYLGNDFNMAKLFIRGVGANTSTTGSETGVALHVDEAFVSRAEAQLTSLFDLERVEVLRGPQGTLYGRNAVGGSINLITAKPTLEPDGYARVTLGNFDLATLEGALGGPITDRIQARVAVKTEDRGGFGTNPVTGNDVDDLKRRMFRAHVQFLPTDAVDILLTGEWYDQDDASRALKFRRESYPGVDRLASLGVGGFAGDRRDLASEIDPRTETETWAVTSHVNWEINDTVSIVNVTNYRDFFGFITQDLDVSSLINSQATTGANTTVQRRDVDSRHFSSELRLHYNAERVNAVFGVFYFDENQRPVDTVGLGPVLGQPFTLDTLADPASGAFPPIGPTGLSIDGQFVPEVPVDPLFALDLCNTFEHIGGAIAGGSLPPPKRVCIKSDLDTEVWAAFGQATFDVLPTFSVKVGGRFSSEERTTANPSVILARNGLGPVIITTTEGTFAERTFDDFTPEVGFEWAPSDDVLVYYTYSEGFKAGAGENAAGSSIIVDPEEIENHEVGLKSAWLDGRLTVNVAAFTYDLTGQQINKTIAGGPAGFSTIFENAGETSADGVELELFAVPADRLRVSAAVSWLDSEYEDFLTKDPLDPRNVSTPPNLPDDPATDFDPTLGDIQLAGNPTRNSPEWSANVHVDFDVPTPQLPYQGRLTLGADVSYRDDVFFTEFNRLLEGAEDYTLLDARIRYTSGSGRFTAEVWGRNLTDEFRETSTFALSTARTIGVTHLAPRTYGLSLGYSF